VGIARPVTTLIRQAELGYDMNNAVDLHYGEGGIDHVKLMEAFGCPAQSVERPGDIADTLRWASREAERVRLPVLVEIMVEREANAAMGVSLDAITGVRAAARAGARRAVLAGSNPAPPREPAPLRATALLGSKVA
jgi:glyoxylate carboligase